MDYFITAQQWVKCSVMLTLYVLYETAQLIAAGYVGGKIYTAVKKG
jgi:hypothetical protein